MSIKFEFLPHSGECILITTPDFVILVDAGGSHPFKNSTFKKLKREIPKIDIAIISHIDSDHIGGFKALLNDQNFVSNLKYCIFNEPKEALIFNETSNSDSRSAAQATLISNHIRKIPNIKHINCFHTASNPREILKEFKNLNLTILSPTYETLYELNKEWKLKLFLDKEGLRSSETHDFNSSIHRLSNITFTPDPSLPNKSSIAFILEYNKKSYLLLGDSHITEINKELRRIKESGIHNLKFEFVKLSHHGSKHNINPEFINLIQTNNYIICRNNSSSTSFTLPDRETVAKIVFFNRQKGNNEKLIFYVTKRINSHLDFKDEKEKFNFEIKLLDYSL